jgi:predicted signal transduction protein with EAL and GGDEF domain
VQGVSLSVRSSIGVALAPTDGEAIDALLNNADLALYAAKSQGRGRYRFFSPEMGAQTRRRQQLEEGLRSALVNGEMHLLFQPQIGLEGWNVVGFEALLRWVHPQLGEVGAVEFIPVAEEAGLIGEIGAWVLHEACRCALQWPAALSVSVNVSRVQALSHELCERVDAVLAGTGLAPRRLELELSQAMFFGDRVDAPALLGVLTAMRSRGVRIALEDFATARSSLADLRRFPFDTLKIDRVYVRELLSRRDARAIVKMLIGLAGSLNIRTIAAGVEEPAQVEVLARYGCVAMQGHFGARPMAAGEIAAFLDGWRSRPRPRQEGVPTEPMALV